MSIREQLRAEALALGFSQAGFAPAAVPPSAPRLLEWLEAGAHASLEYMAKEPTRRMDPRTYWPEAQTLLVVSLGYAPTLEDPPCGPLEGRVARYARGEDYHEVMKVRLQALGRMAEKLLPGLRWIAVVDASAVLERAHAVQAGLGWFGKNSMLLSRAVGSYTLLGVLLLNQKLEPDAPTSDHCGSCRRCVEACPTQAIVAPGQVDARRCVSAITIELRGMLSEPQREGWKGWVFGCDICQEVCPWVKKAGPHAPPEMLRLQPERAVVSLATLLTDTPESFAARWKKSAVKRTKRVGLARNAAFLLGQSPDHAGAVELLKQGLTHDEPVVRGASGWALATQGGAQARLLLERACAREPDAQAQGVMQQGLARGSEGGVISQGVRAEGKPG
ncbi:MAG: tRNA epoxyqueuosine(34) reductase QueG [Myxococcota bacterium]